VADEPEAAIKKWRSSSDVKEVTIKKKFVLALLGYAVLGVLAWTTLSDEPIHLLNANIRLRTGTLLILGLFAFRAALYFWRTRIEEEQARVKPTE
jgi:hypothetical protein